MSEIIIRENLETDAEQVLAFLCQIGAESDNLSFGKEGLPITVKAEREYLSSVQQDPHSVSIGAFDGKKMIGNGSLSGMPRRMSHRAELGLSVLKEYWNKGDREPSAAGTDHICQRKRD
jgi:RimJ/RimL family protein N-acetyltransferase